MMAYLDYPTPILVPIPIPGQSKLGLIIMFGCVSTDLDQDLGRDRWVAYPFNTDLGTIPLHPSQYSY